MAPHLSAGKEIMAAAVATAVVKTRKELTNNSPKQRCLERLSKLSSLPLSSLIAPIDDEEAASSWCWILNYGIGQTSKIHSLTDLPCSADAEELVGLLAKVSFSPAPPPTGNMARVVGAG